MSWKLNMHRKAEFEEDTYLTDQKSGCAIGFEGEQRYTVLLPLGDLPVTERGVGRVKLGLTADQVDELLTQYHLDKGHFH